MGDDDELRLNELRRFRKSASRLALEAHSHCEVPAGCGGVVLRWRRPDEPIGFQHSFYVAGALVDVRVDGDPLKEQRVFLQPGAHVISARVERPTSAGFLLFRAALDPTIRTAREPTMISQGDGHWRASLVKPAAGWRRADFDDRDFFDLVELEVPAPDGREKWSWDYLQRDAKGLGLPAEHLPAPRRLLRSPRLPEAIWMRCRFELDHGGFR